MPKLLAVDVAILPPPDVTQRAIGLSASLPHEGSQELRLDAEHLPHVTLMQLFARESELDTAFDRVTDVVRDRPPLRLLVSGGGQSNQTVWMTIQRTPELLALHERLLEALRGVERQGGSAAAFFEGDARVGDVMWVTGYRLKSSLEQYTPHITLGHASAPPGIEPFAFDATTVAACHLGRFCTCRRVLRQWTLGHPTR
jgi:2'-5' RNA ligase